MYKVIIVIVSDSSYFDNKKDLTGPLLIDIFKENNYEVVDYKVVPDEIDKIEEILKKFADENVANLIITSGGTGFNKCDVTPEATMNIIDKYVPGFGELMRMKSYDITHNSILSRECSGIRKNTLIINLPGSPKAAKENLGFILDSISHGLKMLNNEKNDCANMIKKR